MHKNNYFCIVVTFMYVLSSPAIEYIYPLTSSIDNEQEVILFMHQTHEQETRLWSVNNTTYQYEQLLSSRYNPVGVVLLPDKSGFSFLDNGLIKVKKFLKRSPKTIEIYEPIYNFGVPQWLDDTICLLHAKEGNRFGIYQVDLDGQVSTIMKSSSSDYLYPQKVGDNLFFVARDLAGQYYVKKIMDYATQNIKIENVQDFEQNSLINLLMINEHEGFVIEYVSDSDALLTFNFYQFKYVDENWYKKILFIFYVPTFLFFDKSTMLRDPMAAMFPRVTSDKIYFVSSLRDEYNMKHYCYNLKTDMIEICKTYSYVTVPNKTVMGDYHHILMPIVTQNNLLSGFAWK